MERPQFDRLNRPDDLPSPPLHVRIVVAGVPVAKGRPKVRVFKRKGEERSMAQAYTPTKTRRYEDLLRLEAGRVMEGRAQLEGPLRVEINVFVAMPQTLAKSKAKAAQAEAGTLRPLTKPDVDNYAKCMDALNGIVWRDDSEIVSLLVDKFYSSRPRLELKAFEL